MRTHEELIECVLKHFDEYFISGLCWVINRMKEENLLSKEERDYLLQLLKDNKPKDHDPHNGWYYWPECQKEPRMQWLNNQININS